MSNLDDSPARRRLADLVDDTTAELPLDLGAALLAADERHHVDVDAVLGGLDELARGLHIPEEASVYEQVARLNHHLFTVHGFEGDSDSYDDPENSCLDRVLERRKGLPILLSLVAIEVGRRAGVPLVGVGFPGHFIVAPAEAEDQFWIDPFHGGRTLRREHLETWLRQINNRAHVREEDLSRATRPASTRDILVRMNHNLKGTWVRRRSAIGVLRAVLRLRILQPEDPEHIRDTGLLLAEVGDAEQAVEHLEAFLALRPDSPQGTALQHLIAELRAGRAG